MSTDSALLRLPQVLATVGLGRTAWLDLVKARKAPQPIKIGRATMWHHEELQAWIQGRVAAYRSASPPGSTVAVEPAARFKGSRDKYECIEDELAHMSFELECIHSSVEAIRALLEQFLSEQHNAAGKAPAAPADGRP